LLRFIGSLSCLSPLTPSTLLPYTTLFRSWRHREVPTEVGTGFEPVYTALQAVASPLGQPTGDARASYGTALPTRCRERRSPGADDRIRTGDPPPGQELL